MGDKTFQEMIDDAVEKAVDHCIERLVEKALDHERFCSVPEIAQLTGYSEPAIREWINRNYDPLPAYRVEKGYRIRLKEFEAWFEQYKIEKRRKVVMPVQQ